MDFKNKKVAILGWGMDTQDVEPWLKTQGVIATILDEKKDGKPFGDLSTYEVLVRSPGVYRYKNEIVEAEERGVIVTSKTKIFFDVFPGKIIGVTGTKGKGTTSTLIYQILKEAGREVILGGNVGMGLFDKNWNSDTWAVVELSSFQLIDLHKSAHIGVVLMTTSDHLDWHKSGDEYVQAKGNLFRFQRGEDYAVVNKDYENSRKIGEMGMGKKIWVSGKDFSGKAGLRGQHNKENIAAAIAVSKIIGIEESVFLKVVSDFKGLEHRLEEVARVNGVTYFDDSFSTTPETTIAAIKSFAEPMILIAGGSEKGSDFNELGRVIAESSNIKAVILIGEMATRIEEAIANNIGLVKLIRGCKSMQEIVAAASNAASPGDVVVLSPACASFDMFKNYKERGDEFKKEVGKLC
jgi:UDP-N-acetylmuramoylalanine--D-glutamate ligase